MSIEMATAFKSVTDQDPGLRAEAMAAYQAGGLEAVAALAAGRGYAFTPVEAESALIEGPAEDGELSDAALDAVAGGKGRPSPNGGRMILFPVFNPRPINVPGPGFVGPIPRAGAVPSDP